MDKEELLNCPEKDIVLFPCPFCGSNPIIGELYKGNCYCPNESCPISGFAFHISIWNTRQQSASNHKEMCGVHDGKCHVCGEETNSYGANPLMWSIFLPHIDGQTKHRYYHVKCLYPILQQSASGQSDKATSVPTGQVKEVSIKDIENFLKKEMTYSLDEGWWAPNVDELSEAIHSLIYGGK